MTNLRWTLVLCLAVAVSACGQTEGPSSESKLAAREAPLQPALGAAVPDSYIVTLAEGADAHAVAAAAAASPRHVYSVIHGFAATLNAHQLAALRTHPHVVAIEQDQIYTADTTQSFLNASLDAVRCGIA